VHGLRLEAAKGSWAMAVSNTGHRTAGFDELFVNLLDYDPSPGSIAYLFGGPPPNLTVKNSLS
jgi:hypothetical protein